MALFQLQAPHVIVDITTSDYIKDQGHACSDSAAVVAMCLDGGEVSSGSVFA